MDRRIFHIIKQLPQSLSRSWSVEDMAALVQISVPHFQRLFKLKTAFTPMAYLNNLRLETARELLSDSSCFLQIKEIRVKVGLTNDSHFTRDFKQKYDRTPTEFRVFHAEIEQSVPPDGQE